MCTPTWMSALVVSHDCNILHWSSQDWHLFRLLNHFFHRLFFLLCLSLCLFSLLLLLSLLTFLLCVLVVLVVLALRFTPAPFSPFLILSSLCLFVLLFLGLETSLRGFLQFQCTTVWCAYPPDVCLLATSRLVWWIRSTPCIVHVHVASLRTWWAFSGWCRLTRCRGRTCSWRWSALLLLLLIFLRTFLAVLFLCRPATWFAALWHVPVIICSLK